MPPLRHFLRHFAADIIRHAISFHLILHFIFAAFITDFRRHSILFTPLPPAMPFRLADAATLILRHCYAAAIAADAATPITPYCHYAYASIIISLRHAIRASAGAIFRRDAAMLPPFSRFRADMPRYIIAIFHSIFADFFIRHAIITLCHYFAISLRRFRHY